MTDPQTTIVEDDLGQLPYYALARHAQKAIDLSGKPGWSPWKFAAVEGGINCTGAVCPIGDNGLPDWNKPKRWTKQTIFVPVERKML